LTNSKSTAQPTAVESNWPVGLTPFNVLYNLVGAGTDVTFSGGSTDHVPNAQVYGTVLAPERSVKFTPGIVFGEIISGGQELTLTSGSDAFGLQPGSRGFSICAALWNSVARVNHSDAATEPKTARGAELASDSELGG
jgi:hypothetical protein